MTNREAYKNAFSGVQRGDLCGFIQSNLLWKHGLCCPDVDCDECLGKMFETWLDKKYEASEKKVERAKMTSRTRDEMLYNHCALCKHFHLELQEGGGCLEICEVTGGRVIWSDEGLNKSDNCPFMGTREEAKADSGRE